MLSNKLSNKLSSEFFSAYPDIFARLSPQKYVTYLCWWSLCNSAQAKELMAALHMVPGGKGTFSKFGVWLV